MIGFPLFMVVVVPVHDSALAAVLAAPAVEDEAAATGVLFAVELGDELPDDPPVVPLLEQPAASVLAAARIATPDAIRVRVDQS